MSSSEVDVLVIGSGAAGLAASLTAYEQGARVMVAEAETVVGGATRLSSGWIMAADTKVQRDFGLDGDTAQSLFEEYMLLNQSVIKPSIARRLAFDGAAMIDWLTEMGVYLYPFVVQGGGERVPRSHVPKSEDAPGGQHIVDVLSLRCRERGIEIALGNRVDRLLERDGAVVGVSVGREEIEAGAVVLATGGFGANGDLIEKHLPTMFRAGDWRFYIGPDSSKGDALALGEQVNASTVGFDRSIANLTPHPHGKEFDAYLPGWMLVVGPDGRRLFSETSAYGVTFGIARAVGGAIFGIFDAAILAENNTETLPTFKAEYPAGSPLPPDVYSTEGIERLIEAGDVVSGQTVEEVAEQLGIPVAPTVGAVGRYNSHVAAGEDRDFLKPSRFLRSIATPPYYGMEIRPAAVGLTCYGLEIDAEAHVIDRNSGEIEGLFAAGECTGGVVGPLYLGSGNSLANCLIFGRAAGYSAATYALNTGSPRPFERSA